MQINDKDIQLDKDGFMIDPDLWNDAIARTIANEEGIEEMSEEHWKIVNFIRNYWRENNLAPTVRLLCQETGISLRHIYKLFTSGPARGACRIAGLPKPDGCV